MTYNLHIISNKNPKTDIDYQQLQPSCKHVPVISVDISYFFYFLLGNLCGFQKYHVSNIIPLSHFNHIKYIG